MQVQLGREVEAFAAQARVKICVHNGKKGTLILNCTVAKRSYFKLSRSCFSPFPHPITCGKTQFTSAEEIWLGIFVHSALANLSSLCFSIALFSLPCFFWFLCPQGQVEIPELTLMICECYWKQLSGRSPVLQTGSLILLGEKALFFTSKQVLIT